MKKICSKLMIFLFILLIGLPLLGCDNEAAAKTIHISTPDDLLQLANGGNFILDNDIDCRGAAMGAMRVKTKALNIDGNGHSIKNLEVIPSDSNCTGFIGYASKPISFSNLGLDLKITKIAINSENYTGLIAGICASKLKLDNCKITGSINCDTNGEKGKIGGLVGSADVIELNDVLLDIDMNIGLKDVHLATLSIGSTYLYIGGIAGTVRWLEIYNSMSIGGIKAAFAGEGHGGVIYLYGVSTDISKFKGKGFVYAPRKIIFNDREHYTSRHGIFAPTREFNGSRFYVATNNENINIDKDTELATAINVTNKELTCAEACYSSYNLTDADGNEVRLFLEFSRDKWNLKPLASENGDPNLVLFS